MTSMTWLGVHVVGERPRGWVAAGVIAGGAGALGLPSAAVQQARGIEPLALLVGLAIAVGLGILTRARPSTDLVAIFAGMLWLVAAVGILWVLDAIDARIVIQGMGQSAPMAARVVADTIVFALSAVAGIVSLAIARLVAGRRA